MAQELYAHLKILGVGTISQLVAIEAADKNLIIELPDKEYCLVFKRDGDNIQLADSSTTLVGYVLDTVSKIEGERNEPDSSGRKRNNSIGK